MKITKRQLRTLIREAIDIVNAETGEVHDFGEDSISGIPDDAVPDLIKRLGLNMSPNGTLSNADFEKLEDETLGKQHRRDSKRKVAQFKADEERLNVDNLMQRVRDWASDVGTEYIADVPGTDLQDIAFDLADAAKFEFEQDEWDELLWHFDNDENELRAFVADSIG